MLSEPDNQLQDPQEIEANYQLTIKAINSFIMPSIISNDPTAESNYTSDDGKGECTIKFFPPNQPSKIRPSMGLPRIGLKYGSERAFNELIQKIHLAEDVRLEIITIPNSLTY